MSGEEHTTALPQRTAGGIELLPLSLVKTNPFTLREGQGITVQNVTASTVGTFGLLAVFSVEPTHAAD